MNSVSNRENSSGGGQWTTKHDRFGATLPYREGSTGCEGAGSVSQHPLLQKPLIWQMNWHQWMQLWNTTAWVPELVGLLHSIFSVKMERWSDDELPCENVDRIIFLLQLADGWRSFDCRQLRTPLDGSSRAFSEIRVPQRDGGDSVERGASFVRRMIAEKAFNVLAKYYFKVITHIDPYTRQTSTVWEEEIVSEKLWPHLQHFFRTDPSDPQRCVNLAVSNDRSKQYPEEGWAVAFVCNLAEFVWSWKAGKVSGIHRSEQGGRGHEAKDAAMHQKLLRIKIWLIDTLNALDRLNLFRGDLALTLEEECLSRIKEIALSTKTVVSCIPGVKGFGPSIPVASMDEAMYEGSRAAYLYNELMTRRRVYRQRMSRRRDRC